MFLPGSRHKVLTPLSCLAPRSHLSPGRMLKLSVVPPILPTGRSNRCAQSMPTDSLLPKDNREQAGSEERKSVYGPWPMAKVLPWSEGDLLSHTPD